MVDKISIIIPAFIDTDEKQQWLNEAIQSALNQTYPHKEVIVIDDCSPIPVEYDKAIRLNKNVAPSIARNTAVHYSTGDLILPLDADDILKPNALELLYNDYKPDHFVYGDLTLIENGKNGRSTHLPKFECRNVLNVNGMFPVTCLHSVESHKKAGGWKSILKHGLEDVEYWISMVRQCILGIKCNHVVMYYRQHPSSRTRQLEFDSQINSETKSIIREMHKDLYDGGNMPCRGCGGGGKRRNTKPQAPVVSSNLLDYPDSEKMTIQYNGPRQGSFGIVGTSTGVSYRIQGNNSTLEIHKNDWNRFKNLDAGKAFSVVTVAKSEPPVVNEYKPSAPEIVEQREFNLSQLDMSKAITTALHEKGWTVEKIATQSKVGDLKVPNVIGAKTELRIMERAKALYFN